jgi:hypothetical protein
MANITRELLQIYLDDALTEEEAVQVEQALRGSEALRHLLKVVMQERDRGEHSIGAVWRRNGLSCPTREQLGSFLLQVLDDGMQDYIEFHVKVVGCPTCHANLTDLQALQQEAAPKAQARRQRFFESSAGLLRAGRQTRSDR